MVARETPGAIRLSSLDSRIDDIVVDDRDKQ
jgi:hypothetical protein